MRLWKASLVLLLAASSSIVLPSDKPAATVAHHEWRTGTVVKIDEVKRFVPAAEQELRGVRSTYGNSTEVELGVTRRYAVYTVTDGAHL